jgi:hypothetical protein
MRIDIQGKVTQGLKMKTKLFIVGILAVMLIAAFVSPVGASSIVHVSYSGFGNTHIVTNNGIGLQGIFGSQSGSNNVLIAKNINSGNGNRQSIVVSQSGTGNIQYVSNINTGSANTQSIIVIQN